jgi:RNA polymerase subunit RPABC4/transcription elongation factor Spt4
VCRAGVEADFLVCPVCTSQLKQPCPKCAAALQPSWLMCPYCATSTVTAVREVVTPDLDAALTAEAALTKGAAGNGNGNGRPARLRKTRSSG